MLMAIRKAVLLKYVLLKQSQQLGMPADKQADREDTPAYRNLKRPTTESARNLPLWHVLHSLHVLCESEST